jgi:hypothetical protein
MLLMEIVQDGNAELCDGVLSLAGRYGRSDAESIRQCYYNLTKKGGLPEPLTLGASTPLINYIPNLSAYDSLTGGGMNV